MIVFIMESSAFILINKSMMLYIIISLVIWFVVPLLIEGRVKRKSDRRAYQLLCRILSAAIIMLGIYHLFT